MQESVVQLCGLITQSLQLFALLINAALYLRQLTFSATTVSSFPGQIWLRAEDCNAEIEQFPSQQMHNLCSMSCSGWHLASNRFRALSICTRLAASRFSNSLVRAAITSSASRILSKELG